MQKCFPFLLLISFIMGFIFFATPVYAQSDWGDWFDDDDDDDDDDEYERELFRKASNEAPRIEYCNEYLEKYPNGPRVETIKEFIRTRTGQSPDEIRREPGSDIVDPLDLVGHDVPDKIDKVDRTTRRTERKPLTIEEIEFMRAGGSFWGTNSFSHVHIGLSFSFIDWEGTITAGTGSHTDLNLGVEYSLREALEMPLSAIAEFGLRLTNKNPWDNSTGFFAGWIGAKYLIMEPNADEGFSLAASALLGFGTGRDEENDHEKNLAIWLGHHHPVLFQLTPIVGVSGSYKLNKDMAINADAMFLFYSGLGEETDEPMDQMGISISAEYFIAVSIVGLHAGLNFRTGYDPMLSMYINATSIFGAFVQFVVPFTTQLEYVKFALTIGYDLKF